MLEYKIKNYIGLMNLVNRFCLY